MVFLLFFFLFANGMNFCVSCSYCFSNLIKPTKDETKKLVFQLLEDSVSVMLFKVSVKFSFV